MRSLGCWAAAGFATGAAGAGTGADGGAATGAGRAAACLTSAAESPTARSPHIATASGVFIFSATIANTAQSPSGVNDCDWFSADTDSVAPFAIGFWASELTACTHTSRSVSSTASTGGFSFSPSSPIVSAVMSAAPDASIAIERAPVAVPLASMRAIHCRPSPGAPGPTSGGASISAPIT